MPWQNDNDGNRPNNPWGNNGGSGPRRGGGGEPPHIDEFIKKGQDQLKNVMPGGKGGFSLIVVIAAILWLATGYYSVGSSELGVELRFGKYLATTGPGPHWKLPYPIDTVEILNVKQQRSISIGSNSSSNRAGRGVGRSNLRESLMLTGDENIVDIQFNVVWNIKIDEPLAARNFLFNIRDPEHTVRMVSQGAMREVVGKTPIDFVIKEGKETVESETLERIRSVLDNYQSGIDVLRVEISVADPPQNVIEFFQDVQKADLDKETYKNEAEAYARKIIPEAEGRAAKIIQQAEAYRAQTVAKAEGDAARFLSVYNEYSRAKDVTKKRLYLETMESILEGMDKIILDQKNGGTVPYLSIDELRKNKQQKDSVS